MKGFDSLKKDDKKLLDLLQNKDACTPRITFLARKMGLPTSTVQAKLDKFEKEGYIQGYSAELDPEKVEKSLVAFKFVRKKFQKPEDMHKFGEYLAKLPGVQEVYFTVGEWGFVTKWRFRDHRDYVKTIPQIGVWSDACQGMMAPKTFKDSRKVIID
ncbi:MAG: Lrp/AsnC ligand binding domain-containing protein [archaeon]